MKRQISLLACGTIVLFLGFQLGCAPSGSSGGSSGPSSSSDTTMSDPTQLTGENQLDAEEQEFLNLINQYRTQNGLGILKVSITLTNASQWMAQDMASNDYLAHTDSLARDAWTRIASFFYPPSTWGENCAAGSSTAAGVFQQWKNSPGHNANMLDSSFQAIGIGRSFDAKSKYKNYWTTDFGSTVDKTIN